MARVLLVDIDSKIPNLALMKISQWHKNQGDEVGFSVSDPDLVYGSCIFKDNAPRAYQLFIKYANAKVQIGGPGIGKALLPDEINILKPDYSLYPDLDYSIGYSTRGCPRKCFDIRLINFEIAERLALIKMFPGHLHTFAFDDIKDKEAVLRGIEHLAWHKIHLKNKVMFFVYVHDDSQVDDALERCNILKQARTNPYIMCNIDQPRTARMKQLQRWANRKPVFWTTSFNDYVASQGKIMEYHQTKIKGN